MGFVGSSDLTVIDLCEFVEAFDVQGSRYHQETYQLKRKELEENLKKEVEFVALLLIRNGSAIYVKELRDVRKVTGSLISLNFGYYQF